MGRRSNSVEREPSTRSSRPLSFVVVYFSPAKRIQLTLAAIKSTITVGKTLSYVDRLFGKYADLLISRECENYFFQNAQNALCPKVLVVFVGNVGETPRKLEKMKKTFFVTAWWVLKLFRNEA